MLDGDTLLANKKSILSEIAPKIIVYSHPKRKTIVEVRSLFTAYEELTVGLEITSVEYLSKTSHSFLLKISLNHTLQKFEIFY